MAAKKKKKKPIRPVNVLLFILALPLFIFLPFFLLIRISVFLNVNLDLNAWISLLVGVMACLGLLFFYLQWLRKRILGKSNKKERSASRKWNLRIAMVLLLTFCVYALFFLSSGNAKTRTVQGEYQSSHPILRMAVGAMTLFDREAVVTDLSRVASDYNSMGLAQKKQSLHYVQEDGYVHAADIRVKGRAGWRNWLLKASFWVMGFHAVRHGGSEDHLHISLPLSSNPKAW